ncbi:MAG: GP88 family protein [Bacteriovoracaceae bacterium]
MQLITSNSKTDKSNKFDTSIHTGIVQLYPNKKTCPSSTKECLKHCLVNSGMGNMPSVKKARKERTAYFMKRPDDFWEQLDAEITLQKVKLKMQGKKLALRINGFSDIEIPTKLFKKHNDVQFYDYTKNYSFLSKSNRWKNYHLTFSYSGNNLEDCKKALKRGFNVALVARDKSSVYKLFKNNNIIDGDSHDLRFLDPKNSIVMLSPKGVNKSLKNDFIN